MANKFERGIMHTVLNPVIKGMLSIGIGPKQGRILSVSGRRSGRRYETPVNLVDQSGQRYLVSPYGNRSWTTNARAAGVVGIRRGKQREQVRLEELDDAAAAPVLRQYLKENPITKPYFDVSLDSSDEAFAAEAGQHPVFRLVAASPR